VSLGNNKKKYYIKNNKKGVLMSVTDIFLSYKKAIFSRNIQVSFPFSALKRFDFQT